MYWAVTEPKAGLGFIGKKMVIILELKFHFDENTTQYSQNIAIKGQIVAYKYEKYAHLQQFSG